MREILKDFKNIFKTVFTKDNLEKFIVYSFLAIPLILLFIGFFCVPSNAQTTTTNSEDYNEGYTDGYNNGYNDATNNIVENLQFFNALELYYQSAMLFISTDGGQTYSNTSGQDYSIDYSVSYEALHISKSNPWNGSALYYLDVSFTTPININTLRVPSAKHPILNNVVIGDSSFEFTYDYIDGVPYLLTRNMLSSLTNNLKFYFSCSGYMNDNTSKDFYVYIDGFIGGVDSYQNGYREGQEALQPTISNLQANINILKNEITTLQATLNNTNGSWQSVFFAMADTPFKTASNFLGFELFGVNLFNALIGFITILAIFWVFKRLVK